jgi:hypothetical protein
MMHTRNPLIIVVGDAARIYPGLSAIAPVRLLSAEGDSLDPARLTAQPGGLELDLARLVPVKDSFSVMVQGNPMGWQRTELARSPAGFTWKEETRIGTFVEQTTTVELGSEAMVRSVAQQGKTQGKDTHINIAYADGRVRGEALVAAQPAFKTLAIDTAIAAGTLDDNSIQALLPALHWSPDASWTIPVFAAGQNAIVTMHLAVKGTETVQVPAGSFETYRAEMTGGPATVNFFVTTAAPHRLVKVTLVGVPLEFQLAK